MFLSTPAHRMSWEQEGAISARSSNKNANILLPISAPIVVAAMKSDAIYAHYIQLRPPKRKRQGSKVAK